MASSSTAFRCCATIFRMAMSPHTTKGRQTAPHAMAWPWGKKPSMMCMAPALVHSAAVMGTAQDAANNLRSGPVNEVFMENPP